MPSRSNTPELADDLSGDGAQEALPPVDKSKLNPVVMPSGAVRPLYVTEGSRGATPPVCYLFLPNARFLCANKVTRSNRRS